jgi:predicted MFS family arabinose efflux permease
LAASSSSSVTGSQRAGLWMLAFGQTLVWAGLFYIFAALLLSWERDLGWPKTDLTIGFTLAVLAAAAMSPLGGRIVDAGGGRWLLGGGALAGALGLVALSMVESRVWFILAWMWIGLSHAACLYEPCFAFVTRVAGDQARRAITRITLVAGFASPIAFPAGAALSDMLGWRGAVLVFAGVVGFVAAPLLFFGAGLMQGKLAFRPHPGRKALDRQALRAAIRKPAFWLMAAAFPLLSIEHGILIAHIIPLLVERGFALATAVAAASMFGPMQVAGRLLMMTVENRARSTSMMLLSYVGVTLAALILLAAGLNVVLVFAFAATQGASFGLISILKPPVIAETLGRTAYGAISGWLAVPYLVGGAFGPYVGAILWELGGYQLVLWATVGMALAGLVLILLLIRLGTRSS